MYFYSATGCDQYHSLTDTVRNINHEGEPFYSDKNSCDDTSPGWKGAGWYRFEDDAGVMMPESYPGLNKCGSGYPGWLQGSHPQGFNETKDVTACFPGSNTECYNSMDIKITNCGDFYVYYLPEVSYCEDRYCGADNTTTNVG